MKLWTPAHRLSAEGRILIEVGELRRTSSALEVPVTVTPYSDEGEAKVSDETVWRCRQTLTAADGSYSVLRSLPGDEAPDDTWGSTAREGGLHLS